jgi:uncharacterized membrane protein YhaH (DUF805 family)
MYVYTSKQEKINLANEAFSSGGEGEVRKVISSPSRFKNICVKLYYQKKRTPQQESKIKYMVQNPPQQVEGTGFMIGWPLDYVSDASGNFMGFIMPLAYPNSKQLIILTAPKLSNKLGSEWFDRYDRSNGKYALIARLKLINNIAIPIHLLHSTGKYVLKDFKPENVLITHDGKVTLVDMDSVQISEGNRMLFSGTAATPNYIPPEYYSRGVGKSTTVPLQKSWDNFAIGVVFYQILFGLHPYVVTPWVLKDSSCNEIFQNIAQNLFPYGPNRSKIKSFPDLHKKFEVLPPIVQKMFLSVFSDIENSRPSAEDWGKEVHKLVVAAGAVPKPVPVPRPKPSPKRGPKPTPRKPTPSIPSTVEQPGFWESMFSFSGRSRRSRYWLTGIVCSIMYVVALFALVALMGRDENTVQGIATILYIPLLWACLANCSKRLHDLGKSAGWIIVLFIPFINLGLAIYMAFFEGEQSDNEYGPSPY